MAKRLAIIFEEGNQQFLSPLPSS